MAKYTSQNKSAIDRAFGRFFKSSEAVMEAGMIRVAEVGMEVLVELHQMSGLEEHIHEENTIGYAVSHNGVIVRTFGGSGEGGNDLPGSAKEQAAELLANTSGWRVIILSQMEGWYNVIHETDILRASAEEIRSNFNKYFEKIEK